MPTSEQVRDRIAFLRSLRAVRQFRPEPVEERIVDDILEVARWSGSAKNRQPWELVVIRRPETLRALAAVDGSVGHLAGAALGVVLVMSGAPGHEERETFDDGRLSERIMLAAAAHGVGSSIGWFSGRGRDAAKTLLRVPPQHVVRTAISIGYPDPAARSGPRPSPARKPLAEILHRETYSAG